MDPNRKITKKFTKKFGSKVINRQYFHRKTGLQCRKVANANMSHLVTCNMPCLTNKAMNRNMYFWHL